MTTEPEAHAFLTDLTRLAQALDDAVLDSGLPAASGENAGIARSLPKSKSPCDDALGDMRRDALAYIQQWAGNLSSDLMIGGVPHGETSLEPWTRWLIRHRVDLVSRPWWPDAEEELRNVHRHLGDHLAPPAMDIDELVMVCIGAVLNAVQQWHVGAGGQVPPDMEPPTA